MLRIDELIGAVDAAEGPSITLDRQIGEKLQLPAARFTSDLAAARRTLPEGWGFVLDATPGRPAYAEALGPKLPGADYPRVGTTGATPELALASAGLRAQQHVRQQATLRAAH